VLMLPLSLSAKVTYMYVHAPCLQLHMQKVQMKSNHNLLHHTLAPVSLLMNLSGLFPCRVAVLSAAVLGMLRAPLALGNGANSSRRPPCRWLPRMAAADGTTLSPPRAASFTAP